MKWEGYDRREDMTWEPYQKIEDTSALQQYEEEEGEGEEGEDGDSDGEEQEEEPSTDPENRMMYRIFSSLQNDAIVYRERPPSMRDEHKYRTAWVEIAK